MRSGHPNRRLELTIPELGFVAITRGLGGAGIGLLLAGKLQSDARRKLGWMLLAFGALTTVPIALEVIRRRARGTRATESPSDSDYC